APGKGLPHMKHPSALLGGLALAFLAFPAAQARADPSPTWTYDWSQSDTVVGAVGAGTGGIHFTPPAADSTATGTSDIIAANLTTSSTPSAAAPDPFNGQGYTLRLRLTDGPSQQSGLFVFSGKLFGTLTADSAVLSSTFNAPVTLSRAVGGHLYTVTIGPFSGPSGPNSDN